MIKDAEAHADEAHKLRELADARNNAEALAYQTEKSLKEHRDKLDEADASTIEGRIMELQRRARVERRRRDPAKTDALQEASHEAAPRRSTRRRPPRRPPPPATATARRSRRRGDRGRRLEVVDEEAPRPRDRAERVEAAEATDAAEADVPTRRSS